MKSLREHRDPLSFHLFCSAYLDASLGGAKLEQADGAYRLIVTSTSPVGRTRLSAAKARVKVDDAWIRKNRKSTGIDVLRFGLSGYEVIGSAQGSWVS